MLSFGELKNLLKRFNDCNKGMSLLQGINDPRERLEEKDVKTEEVRFYLKILHYGLIKYCPELYMEILSKYSNIIAMSDQKFTESAFAIARDKFKLTPVITVEQFLMPGKWIEKKLELVVEVCQAVRKWEAERKKNGKGGRGELKNFMKETQVPKMEDVGEDSDDDEVLMQREITVKPMEFPSKNTAPRPLQGLKPIGKQPLPLSKPSRPNVFPRDLKEQFLDNQEEQDSSEFVHTIKGPPKKIEEVPYAKNKTQPQPQYQPQPQPQHHNHPSTASNPQNQSTEYVSKQQFNEVLEMLASINGTVNGLVSKFNNFQSNVTAWFNNTNARIVLLEQNVKLIKSNL